MLAAWPLLLTTIALDGALAWFADTRRATSSLVGTQLAQVHSFSQSVRTLRVHHSPLAIHNPPHRYKSRLPGLV
ncbi:hypothetical protein LY76DRAFT_586726 [Colletotrichum caudatum]|nr:hypothetical protein LY76DRAFT_586726 [Colletotrichum caudatum]